MPPEAAPPTADKIEFGRHTTIYAACLAGLYIALALPVFGPQTDVSAAIFFATMLLAAGLIALSVIDLAVFRLPDWLTLPLAGAGLLIAYALDWQPDWRWRFGAAVAAYLFIWLLALGYEALRGRPGIGLGDAKLMAAAGAWLGLEGVPAALLYGCAAALLFVVARHLIGRPLGATEPLPFGPFIAIGIWLVWIYGPLV